MPTRTNLLALIFSVSASLSGNFQVQAQLPGEFQFASIFNSPAGSVQTVSALTERSNSAASPGVVAIANPLSPDPVPAQAVNPSQEPAKVDSPNVAKARPGNQDAGLRPRPSADVLDVLSTPSTAYEGRVPDSAAAKRALPPAYLNYDRGWSAQMYLWQSAKICHHPLYFEDAMLERHGHQRMPCLQPAISGAKFFGEMVLLPYTMTLHPPCECRYALGHFRAGSCAPALKDTLPWSRHAALVQSLAATGIIVGLPW